jgi:hypothetical protein
LLDVNGSNTLVVVDAITPTTTANHRLNATTNGDGSNMGGGLRIVGTSSAGSSHNHTVTNNAVTSGAASATENRPLYLSSFYIMRVI